ncbi:MAG: hypothetical protein KGL35_31765, partial [Bradyrhizobium sp.]|nr:hypothetical protein [Bradyrhizobium sp.]
AAIIGVVGYNALEAQARLDRLTEAFKLTGRGAEESAGWISYETDFLNSIPGATSKATDGFISFVAQHAQISAELENQVGQLMPAFIDLYGKQAPQAAGKLALALSDLTESGFRKLDDEMLNLSPQEYETIRNLIQIGDTAKATQLILAQMSGQSGVYVKTLGDQVYDQLQKIKELKAQIASAVPDFSEGQTQLYAVQQLQAAEANLAALRAKEATQGKGAADHAYKREIQDIDAINKKVDERSRLEAQLTEVERGRADASKRGDNQTIGTADQAIIAIKAKLAALDKRDAEQSYSVFEQTENAKAQAFKSGSVQRIDIMAAEVAKAKTLFGTESTQYQEAVGRMTAARRTAAQAAAELAKQQTAQANKLLDAQVQGANAAARSQLDVQRGALQQQLALRQITAAQEIAGEIALEDKLYQIEKAGFEKRLALEKLTPAEKARVNAELEALEQQHTLKIVDLNNKATLAVRDQWEKMLQPIGSAFDQSIKGMIQGTTSFQAAMGNILDSILAEAVDADIKTLLHHIATEAAKTTATTTAATTRLAIETSAKQMGLAMSAEVALKQILNDAWQAASAAFKATAAIPIIGPILAVPAAAAAFTT